VTLLDSAAKADLIRNVARQHPDRRTFVETGTAVADLPHALQGDFDRIVTIEMLTENYLSAANRMLPFPHVQVIHGDSGLILGDVLAKLGPCIIFLDGHEIADAGQSALRQEMVHVAHAPSKAVVLIDDARLLTEERGWMSRQELGQWAKSYGYHSPVIVDDVMHLDPLP